MKKVLLMMMCMMAMTMQAQDVINMNRNFNLSGKCVLYTKTKAPQPTDKGDYRWELKNSTATGENFVTLTMYDADGHAFDSASFHDGIIVFMMKNEEDDTKSIFVNDDTFSHLRIYEIEKDTYCVHLYSSLIADYQ